MGDGDEVDFKQTGQKISSKQGATTSCNQILFGQNGVIWILFRKYVNNFNVLRIFVVCKLRKTTMLSQKKILLNLLAQKLELRFVFAERRLKPTHKNSFRIQCVSCFELYHGRCVNITPMVIKTSIIRANLVFAQPVPLLHLAPTLLLEK